MREEEWSLPENWIFPFSFRRPALDTLLIDGLPSLASVLTRFARPSVSQTWTHAKSLRLFKFLDDCQQKPDVLPLIPLTRRLLQQDVLPVLLMGYAYHLIEQQLKPRDPNASDITSLILSSALWILFIAQWLFAKIRGMQFWAHTTVLLLALPKKVHQISLDTHTIDNTICKKDNMMRVVKGDGRELVV